MKNPRVWQGTTLIGWHCKAPAIMAVPCDVSSCHGGTSAVRACVYSVCCVCMVCMVCVCVCACVCVGVHVVERTCLWNMCLNM